MILDSLYRQLFHPTEAPPTREVAALVAGILLLVMTLNAASGLQVTAGGLSPLLILFAVGGFTGLFWFAAALFTLSSLLGGAGNFQTLLSAVVVGLWPLIFSGAALSLQKGLPLLGALLSLILTLSTVLTLTRSLASAQAIGRWRAFILVFVTLSLSAFAIGGVIVWPLMLLLGL